MRPMNAAPCQPLRWALARLWLARALAWALLLGGWMVLGGLGRQHLPLAAGGQAPVALWLLTTGAVLGWQRFATLTGRRLQAGLLVSGAGCMAALALLPRSSGWLWAVALAWGPLLVGASLTVRRLRQALPASALPSPRVAALLGALAAWWVAGDLGAVHSQALPLAWALGGATLLLAALVPASGLAGGGCRSGLFDCSLMPGAAGTTGDRGGTDAPGAPAGWRHPPDWALVAAGGSMLPMMAGLAAMADWCSNGQWPPAAISALHLGAMLLPAALPACWPGLGRRRVAGLAGGLLLAGGLGLLWPGSVGLMAGALLHGMAWSLVWGLGLRRPALAGQPRPSQVRRATGAGWPLAATAVAVWTLGLAMDRYGPVALWTVHALLAGCGLLGLVALGWPAWRPGLGRSPDPA